MVKMNSQRSDERHSKLGFFNNEDFKTLNKRPRALFSSIGGQENKPLNPKVQITHARADTHYTEPPYYTPWLVYAIHFVLGAGNLLPWNVLIMSIDYFKQLYPQQNVEKVFSVAYMGSSIVLLVLMICGLRQKISFKVRMNLGFCMFIFSLMVGSIMDRARPILCYVVTVISVVVCGSADGLIGGSLVGSAGKLPKQYMQAVFAGTASSGVLASILRIITKASLPQTLWGLRTSTHIYFLVSTIILLACIICCNLLFKLEVMKEHYRLIITHNTYNHIATAPKFLYVARKLWCPGFGVLMIYTVTLSIFPGFIADNLKSNILKDWYPIMLITVYNVSDFIGKSLTGIYILKRVGVATWGCIGRLVFYPLFATCLHGPYWLKTEVSVFALTCVLGLTNGYLTSVIMILVPKSVPDYEAEVSSIVMAIFLGLGLVCGSIFGWLWII